PSQQSVLVPAITLVGDPREINGTIASYLKIQLVKTALAGRVRDTRRRLFCPAATISRGRKRRPGQTAQSVPIDIFVHVTTTVSISACSDARAGAGDSACASRKGGGRTVLELHVQTRAARELPVPDSVLNVADDPHRHHQFSLVSRVASRALLTSLQDTNVSSPCAIEPLDPCTLMHLSVEVEK
ncbi:hypothetical protein BaRGS_00000072, partial [Batillaria attramentaria]